MLMESLPVSRLNEYADFSHFLDHRIDINLDSPLPPPQIIRLGLPPHHFLGTRLRSTPSHLQPTQDSPQMSPRSPKGRRRVFDPRALAVLDETDIYRQYEGRWEVHGW